MAPFILLTSLLSAVVTVLSTKQGASQKIYGKSFGSKIESDESDPLFLTPLIKQGQLQQARKLAAVKPMLRGVESFSGLLTVNETCSSNLFFWLFKSQRGKWEDRPLLVWLQGGPGSSSIFGLFLEVGPYWVNNRTKLRRRKFAWNRDYNLVFIDNPVGTGFSFTKSEAGYSRDQIDVSRDLYEALIQIYTLFPALQKTPLYLTGESYSGKYEIATARKILEMREESSIKLPLSGLMIGSALIDSINMLNHARQFYYLGLIDEKRKIYFEEKENEMGALILSGKFSDARDLDVETIDEMKAITGLTQLMDFNHDVVQNKAPIYRFINETATRRAIHVGDLEFSGKGPEAYRHLKNDYEQSMNPWIEELLTLEKFPILFFSGQTDLSAPYPLSLNFYRSLKWPRAKEYHSAKRCQFKVDGAVAGYFKRAGTFIEVLVRNTGHLVPIFQSKWAFKLMERFVTNSSSFECK